MILYLQKKWLLFYLKINRVLLFYILEFVANFENVDLGFLFALMCLLLEEEEYLLHLEEEDILLVLEEADQHFPEEEDILLPEEEVLLLLPENTRF